jgi:hypothetical protein
VAGEKSESTSGTSLPWFDGIASRGRADPSIGGPGRAVHHEHCPRHPIAVLAVIPLERQSVTKKLVYRTYIQRRISAGDPVGFPSKISTM